MTVPENTSNDIAGQLLGREDRSSWCGDVDPTDRFVCQRIRDHALDLHASRNDAGGIHQWKAGDADGGRENMPAAIPATDPADDPIGTVRIAHWGGGHSVWQHTGGTPGNEWTCVWSTRHGNEGCTMRPEDVAGFPIAGAVPGTPGAASVGDGAGRIVDALLSGLEAAWRDADDLRSSREAWAIEADRLDVIATAARYYVQPDTCDGSDCDHDDEVCVHMDELHATRDHANAARQVPWLEAERERLLTICGKGGDFELDIAEALGMPAGTSRDELIAALASRPDIPADVEAWRAAAELALLDMVGNNGKPRITSNALREASANAVVDALAARGFLSAPVSAPDTTTADCDRCHTFPHELWCPQAPKGLTMGDLRELIVKAMDLHDVHESKIVAIAQPDGRYQAVADADVRFARGQFVLALTPAEQSRVSSGGDTDTTEVSGE